jgi:L-lactate dehydrogenase complex protein LldG
MSARDNILARLRVAPDIDSAEPVLQVSIANLSSEIRLKQLINNLKGQHAEVIDARQSTLLDALVTICASKNIKKVMLPPHDLLALNTWSNGPEILRFNQSIDLLKNDLFNTVDVGVTIADCAIADTGTLIQSNPIRMPRTLSLVPPIHICILDVEHIYENMQAMLLSEEYNKQMPSNLIFISGPSKTADIQQTLAYGAHGPRELIVILTEGL